VIGSVAMVEFASTPNNRNPLRRSRRVSGSR
jgi:hypothetical protein